MRQDEQEIQQIFDQSFSMPAAGQTESACERVLQRLNAVAAVDDRRENSQAPVLSAVIDRRYSGAWSPIAAIAGVAVLSAVAFLALPYIKGWERAEKVAFTVVEGEVGPLDGGKSVRTNDAGAVVSLPDGSRVEMRSQSELSLERADDGLRIRLRQGGVIVTAAKLRTGHLYVQTRDVTVSVTGTVFLVKAEDKGSRVAVIQGEVQVIEGATLKKLLPGQQVATNPIMPAVPLIEEIQWSRDLAAHLALLQQAVQQPIVVPAPLAFEVASFRPGSENNGGGRGGGGGVHLTMADKRCNAIGGPQIDVRRYIQNDRTLYWFIVEAYLTAGCVETASADIVLGGPDWIKSDKFSIDAVIPEGSFTERPQTRNPKLQKMLQNLLAERFKLAVHREMKEMPVYLLSLGRGGSKLAPSKDGDRSMIPPGVPGMIAGTKASMADLVQQLTSVAGRPVLDRTGLAGEFNYRFQFEAIDGSYWRVVSPPPGPSRESLFAVLDDQLGLKLEPSRAPVEVLVIDHAEKPTPN